MWDHLWKRITWHYMRPLAISPAVQTCMLGSPLVVSPPLRDSSKSTLSKQLLTLADECSTPRDETAKAASLWYSFVSELLTDLASPNFQCFGHVCSKHSVADFPALDM